MARLMAAGAGPPPGMRRPLTAMEMETSIGDRMRQVGTAAKFVAIRFNVARIALQEWQKWGHGIKHESDPTMHPTLQAYYAATAEGNPGGANWWSAHAWSAAFTSWVVKQAGVGSDFSYSRMHARYIVAAKRNVVPAPTANPVKAHSAATFAPKLGDLVCKARAGSGATYANINAGMRTHCDIVVGVRDGAVVTIGGNVGAVDCEGQQTVGLTTVCTDTTGRIIRRGTQRGYFAVIRFGP